MNNKSPQITLIFNRRKTASPTVKAAVELRVTYDYKQKYISTGIMLYSTQWKNGKILNCPDILQISKTLDKLQEFLKAGFKVKALAYLKMENGALTGSIAKPLTDAEKASIMQEFDMHDNDIVFVIADTPARARTALGALRVKVAHEQNLIDHTRNEFLWVTDFPMFEYSEEEDRWVAAHHPFTAPKEEDVDKLFTDPEHCSSRAYDLVLNGYELLSGSIRIHDQDLQEKVFEAIGLTMEQAKEKFGFFLEAFRYGTPPHGGVGIGLERLTMVLADTENIRDVVAFPTTNSSLDLMSESPNYVDDAQLDVLGIQVRDDKKKQS